MPRPNKEKKITKLPTITYFNGNNDIDVKMQLEEYETIRLIDYEQLNQTECALRMGVSRSSIVTLYNSARKKLARHLIEGCNLIIDGGSYSINENKQGEIKMKVAVSCVDNEVFQHFGHCPSFLICEVDNAKIINSELVSTEGKGCHLMASFLQSLNVDIVICGGIGAGAKNNVEACGIKVLPGASGNALAQVESYLQGNLVFDPNTTCDHHDENHQCHNS